MPLLSDHFLKSFSTFILPPHFSIESISTLDLHHLLSQMLESNFIKENNSFAQKVELDDLIYSPAD